MSDQRCGIRCELVQPTSLDRQKIAAVEQIYQLGSGAELAALDEEGHRAELAIEVIRGLTGEAKRELIHRSRPFVNQRAASCCAPRLPGHGTR